MKHNKIQQLARMGVFAAIAIILALVESLLPPFFFFAPGAKIGLGNIIVLLSIVVLGYGEAVIILCVKCLFGAIFGGNIFGLVYSVPAGVLSYAFMAILYHFFYRQTSLVAISVVGAVVFNLVQTAVACAVIQTMNYLALLPFMLIASVVAGVLVGLTVYLIVRYVPAKVLIGRE